MVRARVGRLCSLAWLVSTACALLATSARADGPSGSNAAPAVAIIGIDIAGDHPPDLMAQIDAALVRALGEVGFQGLSHDSAQAKLRGEPGLADCASPDCVPRLPQLLGTNQFLRLRVEASSTIYEFEILLLAAEGEGGSVKEQRTDTCPVCTSEEFIDRVADNVRALMQPYQPVPVTLDSRPPGAKLIVDGRELGRAPFSGVLAPGQHQVRAVLAGHLDAEQVIEVVPGKTEAPQSFEIGLTAGPSGGGGDGGGSVWGTLKWPTAIVAAGAIGAGGYWLGIDGDCSTEPSGSGAECPRFYATKGQGFVAIGAGALLGIGAGVMFWLDSGSGSESAPKAESGGGSAFAPDIVPTRGGALGTLRFRF